MQDFRSALDSLVSIGSPDDPAARPLVLRVLVDLFAQRPYHAPVEVAQFEEIVSRLVEKADAQTCALVAARLAAHDCAPPELLAKLARLSVDAAVCVMGSAGVVSPARLAAAAAWGPPEVAAAVARRTDLEPALIAALAMRAERDIALALAGNAAAALSPADRRALAARARDDGQLARALLARPDGALCPALFLHADESQRGAIIVAAGRAALGEAAPGRRMRPPQPLDAARAARLEAAALRQDAVALAQLLMDVWPMTTSAATRIVSDPGGEPLAVALAAMALEETLLERILVFLAAGDGASLARYDRLRALALGLRPALALRLVEAFAGLPESPARPQHRSALDPAPTAGERRPRATVVALERRDGRAVDRA
ncbi:MAG: DUF2336 domain-containing protein [Methylobacteriaceae bacterium]|nr:DUF2336 domain-containing protein [Methylobacteriaceae bacterium]